MSLHQTIEKMIAAAQAAGKPALSDGTVEDLRQLVASGRAALGDGPDIGQISQLAISGRAGSVAARLYRSREKGERGVVIYLHGGGWVCGDLDDYDLVARALVDRTGCAVIAVDYRLAPEHAFPAGLQDVEDAIKWVSANIPALIGRRAPLIVAGDSAGGNLAAAALAAMADKASVTLQCLFYPVTDTNTHRESYRTYGEGFLIEARDMEWFIGQYVSPEQRTDPRVAVVRQLELDRLPPTWLATAEFDVLRDEGEEYASQLAKAGVPVTVVRANGLTHGYIRWFNLIPEADELLHLACRAIVCACASSAQAGDHMGSADVTSVTPDGLKE